MYDHGHLKIVIPTHRRMARLATLGNLPRSWWSRVVLVVDQADYDVRNLYIREHVEQHGVQLLVVPPDVDKIYKKRAWIIRRPEFAKIVMFDDDLRFAVRYGEGTKLRPATPEELEKHLAVLSMTLDDCAHAGWSPRQGNNNVEASYVENTRMMYCLGYDCRILRDLEEQGKISLGRIQTREDMDLTLQLLRLGLKNRVDFTITTDQVGGFAAKGGCTEERTLESSNKDAHLLASLHPGLVKVVQKNYKGSLQREEVVVQWKKAFSSSLPR